MHGCIICGPFKDVLIVSLLKDVKLVLCEFKEVPVVEIEAQSALMEENICCLWQTGYQVEIKAAIHFVLDDVVFLLS